MKTNHLLFLVAFAFVLKATDASAHGGSDGVFIMIYAIMASHILLAAVILLARRASLSRRFLFAFLYLLSIFLIWTVIDHNLLPMKETIYFGVVFIAPVVLVFTFWCLAARSIPRWLAFSLNGLRRNPREDIARYYDRGV
jgi:uncharacterized membrane protein YozB (DUF420 family)